MTSSRIFNYNLEIGKSDQKKIYKLCPICKIRLRAKNYIKHIKQNHDREVRDLNTKLSKVDETEFTNCPQCNVWVKKKNLKKHIQRTHEIQNINNTINKSPPISPKNNISPKEAHEQKRALEESTVINNKVISNYLESNPKSEGGGKFGVPQDKYRRGFYGSASMDYDIWRKGDKEI